MSFRRDAACLAAIVAAAFVFLARALWSGTVIGQYPSDGTRELYFVREFLLQTLAHHRLPLWNPYTQFGEPFLANIQWGVFSPVNALLAWVPATVGYNLFIAIHLGMAGAFMFLLARDWRLDRVPALVAALAFMFSGRVVSLASGGGLNHLSTIAWLPLVLLLFNRSVAAAGKRACLWTAAAAVTVALQLLGGHPQYTLLSMAVLLVVALFKAAAARDMAGHVRPLLVLGAVLVLAIGLGAVQLGLTYQAMSMSTRSFAWQIALPPPQFEGSYHPIRIASWLVPDLFGNPVSLRPASTDWLSLVMKESHSNEFCGYIGVLPLVLAMLTLPRCRTDRTVAMLWTLATGALLLALGRFTPLYSTVYALVPPLRTFRIPARFLSIVVFATALLAGIGAQDVLTAADGRFHRAAKVVAVGALLMLAGVALAFVLRQPLVASGERLAAPLFASRPSGVAVAAGARDDLIGRAFALSVRASAIAAVLAAASAVILAQAGRSGRSTIVATGLVCVVVADLGLQASMYTAGERMNTYFDGNAPLMAILRQSGDGAREYTFEASTPSAKPDPVRPSGNVFMHERLPTGSGYDSFELESYRATRDLIDDDLRHGSALVASAFGLRYIVANVPLAIPSLVEVGRLDGAWIYENSGALPRFYVVVSASKESPDQIVAQLKTHTIRLTGAASLVSFDAEAVELRVHANRDALLVANETFYPGWTARVDGQTTPLLRVNGLVRAIPVSAGDHAVSMEFSPTLLYIGAWISAAFAVFVIAVVTACSFSLKGVV